MLDEAQVRREKLQRARALGLNPYPAASERSASCGEALKHFESWIETIHPITLAGRILTIRVHGGMMFADLQDAEGKLQIAFKEDALGEEAFARFRDLIDPGDIVEASGTLFLTKRGEKTLNVTSWNLLSKALLPLPEKWHGLQDTEIRFRKRYLDLIMNPEVRARLETRSKLISELRTFLDARGFLEVETPTLQPVYGGGFARPFKTHHNALEADFYLRISDEMYLKRLIVGGFERVYEITKVFRNEGIDRDHNPEFTMFEAQIAYQDYRFGMDLFEEIFEHLAVTVLKNTEVPHEGQTLRLSRPWRRMRLVEALEEVAHLRPLDWKTVEEARAAVQPHLQSTKVESLNQLQTIGEITAFAFEECVEGTLIQPTLIYDYPVEVSPLAKRCDDPRFTQRFEAFALGSEIGNNYSELNDPIDLEQRFIEEKKKEQAGFDEAHQTDEDYLDAIRHGMPPVCGLGIGVDRMVMVFTGASNIKEVIAFPTLRPESEV